MIQKVFTSLVISVFLLPALAKSNDHQLSKILEYTHVFELNPILFTNSRWNEYTISKNVSLAQDIYSQCGIKISYKSISKHNNALEEVYFDLEGYSTPDEEHNSNGTLVYGEMFNTQKQVTVFFFERFDPSYAYIMATAVPVMRVQKDDQLPVLNTVWITYQAEDVRQFSLEDGGYPEGYNTFAHELAHILLNEAHIVDPLVKNLMSHFPLNLNGELTEDQCQRMRSSPLSHSI